MNSTSDLPLLSIIIPVYNRQQGLLNLLNSLVVDNHLRVTNTEIIIVDDGSEEAIQVPELDIPLKLYRLPKNSGAPKARRYGFNKSTGDFIHFHDSDDTFGEDWLLKVKAVLESSSQTDILLTARYDQSETNSKYRYQKFFHNHLNNPKRIERRLIYRNCMGPLGGVTFSRKVLHDISFLDFASCQDWQMYLGAISHAAHLKSCPNITYNYRISGNDRISHDPRKKILGHLQLSRITEKNSLFRSNIRLFYLVTCHKYILQRKDIMFNYYVNNRNKLWFYYILISIYWRLT